MTLAPVCSPVMDSQATRTTIVDCVGTVARTIQAGQGQRLLLSTLLRPVLMLVLKVPMPTTIPTSALLLVQLGLLITIPTGVWQYVLITLKATEMQLESCAYTNAWMGTSLTTQPIYVCSSVQA